MTKHKFNYLMKLAKEVGISTLGELAEFKEAKKARTNNELFVALYEDKIGAK